MREIDGFSGYYITSCGKLWSQRTKQFLSTRPDKDGYERISIRNDEGILKTVFIHRLVAQAYLPNPLGLDTVNHKDEVKTHNWLGNLEWMSRADNIKYGTGRARAHENRKRPVYCVELDRVWRGTIDAAKELGIPAQGISKCLSGKQQTCGGYHWQRYVEND